MMAEVSSALTAVGIRICSCVVSDNQTFDDFNSVISCCIFRLNLQVSIQQAEIDRRRGMGVMLFHFEGTLDNLV